METSNLRISSFHVIENTSFSSTLVLLSVSILRLLLPLLLLLFHPQPLLLPSSFLNLQETTSRRSENTAKHRRYQVNKKINRRPSSRSSHQTSINTFRSLLSMTIPITILLLSPLMKTSIISLLLPLRLETTLLHSPFEASIKT